MSVGGAGDRVGPASPASATAAVAVGVGTIEPDDKDWTWVLLRGCPECGYDATALTGREVAGRLRDEVPGWQAALAGPSAAARTRPSPQTWSVLEYGAHVRDLCRLAVGRVRLMLTEDDARFADWDQDATAVAEDYASQDPAVVSGELAAAAAELADLLDSVDADSSDLADPVDAHSAQSAQSADRRGPGPGTTGGAWSRSGLRSNGSAFTVDTFARYVLHDVVHHGHDITA